MCKVNEDIRVEKVLLVPQKFRKEILRRHHDHLWSGHMDKARTYATLRKRFWWDGMTKDVAKYIAECLQCRLRKTSAPKNMGLNLFRHLFQPFEEISIDLFGGLPLTKNGNRYVLSVLDTFSRWPEYITLKTETAEEIAHKLVTEVFVRYGVPKRICSDRGQQFVGSIVTELHK